MVEVKIILKKINHTVPYDYYRLLHGYVVKLMGDEDYGTMTNRYIYSNLIGGEYTKGGIEFTSNPYFIIRFMNSDINLKQTLLNNIPSSTNLFYGLSIDGILINNIDSINNTVFRTLKNSPILIQRKYDKHKTLISDELKDAETFIMSNIIKKAQIANFDIDTNLDIKIIKQHNNKTINYDGVFNNGRVFELSIHANDETKKFILLNGVGKSCGCGFGFIY